MADPGFPRTGANPEGGIANLLFLAFSPRKLNEIQKNGPRGHASLMPLRSATGNVLASSILVLQYKFYFLVLILTYQLF